MPTECLILRRVFPAPVTFADLRRAVCEGTMQPPFWANSWTELRKAECCNPEHGCHSLISDIRTWWHAALKEATGAVDEVYAVIDGREVRVAIVIDGARGLVKQMLDDSPRMNERINDLLDEACRAGYWQRPHEVRHVLEESQMSHRTMARIAANSFIAAGVK